MNQVPPSSPEPEPFSRFNPDFWEVTLDEASWASLPAEAGVHHATPAEAEERTARQERAAALWPIVAALLEECLSERQRQVVELYFMRGLNQRAIATLLGITQQAVSEHLYGKMRGGVSVGGALRKLHKACAERGIRW
jgi:RNA polymerase sigma factor (sigma-70 family)